MLNNKPSVQRINRLCSTNKRRIIWPQLLIFNIYWLSTWLKTLKPPYTSVARFGVHYFDEMMRTKWCEFIGCKFLCKNKNYCIPNNKNDLLKIFRRSDI